MFWKNYMYMEELHVHGSCVWVGTEVHVCRVVKSGVCSGETKFQPTHHSSAVHTCSFNDLGSKNIKHSASVHEFFSVHLGGRECSNHLSL